MFVDYQNNMGTANMFTTACNSKILKTTQMYNIRRTDKQVVVYLDNGINYNKNKQTRATCINVHTIPNVQHVKLKRQVVRG